MNRKGISPVMVFVLAFTMLLLWVFFFSEILSFWGSNLASQTTGIEAMFWDNLNLFAFLIPLIVFILVAFRSGNE